MPTSVDKLKSSVFCVVATREPCCGDGEQKLSIRHINRAKAAAEMESSRACVIFLPPSPASSHYIISAVF